MRRVFALAMLALVLHLAALTGLSRCASVGTGQMSSMDMAGMMHGDHGSSHPTKSPQPERCPTIAACGLAMSPIEASEHVQVATATSGAPNMPTPVVASWIEAPETPPPRG